MTKKNFVYEAPELEVLEIATEVGFANSENGNIIDKMDDGGSVFEF